MPDADPPESSRPSVEQLARFLLVSAREDPALVRRTPPPGADAIMRQLKDLPALLFARPRHEPAQMPDPYLEDLVALAIASARQAEDAMHDAHAAVTRARRGHAMMATLATLGLLVGVGGLARGYIAFGGEAPSIAGDKIAPPREGLASADPGLSTDLIQTVDAAPDARGATAPPSTPRQAPTLDLARAMAQSSEIARPLRLETTDNEETAAEALAMATEPVQATPAREARYAQSNAGVAYPRHRVVYHSRSRPMVYTVAYNPLAGIVANVRRGLTMMFR